MKRFCSLAIFLFFIGLAQAVRSSHNQLRRFSCERIDKSEDAICSVKLTKMLKEENEEEIAPAGVNCYQDQTDANKTRILCPTYCSGASSAFIISKTPSNNNKCIAHITYHIEQHADDFYFWRSGLCLQSNIVFDIGCTFDVFEGSVKVKDYVDKAFKRRAIHKQR